jgi:DNA-binding NarL/FixJ family response regulator
LTPHQVQILRLLTDTVSLSRLGVMVGTSSQAVASRLSEAYRLLGVKDLPQDVRRAAAVRAAEELGVFGDDRPAMFDAA